MTRAVIMAGGDDARWTSLGGETRRHFQLVGAETVIERMVRQLGIEDTVIVAPDLSGYAIPGTTRVDPVTGQWGHEAISTRAVWSATERTILVYGDMIFTDAAMAEVVGFDERAWQLFGRFGSTATKPYGEIFAISFWPEHRRTWAKALETVFTLERLGVIGRAGCWEAFRYMGGARWRKVEVHRRYRSLMTEIDDETDDFDTPDEYRALLTVVGEGVVSP